MNIGKSNSKAADKSMFIIDADAVLVPIVIDTVLFNPASV